MKAIVLLFLLLAYAPRAAAQGIIQGTGGRSFAAKKVSFGGSNVINVDGRSLSSPSVLQWIPGNKASVGASQAVRQRDGQLFLGAIVAADATGVTLRTEPWNEERTIPVNTIAELLFLRRESIERAAPRFGKDKSGILYRPNAPTVPCQLESIKDNRAVIASSIGRFRMPLKMLGRYSYSSIPTESSDGAQWEVGLIDGSVLYGQLLSEGDAFKFTLVGHSALTLPRSAIRYVRNLKAATWLPLWTTGLGIEDAISEKQPASWGQAISIDAGRSITLPASDKSGTLQFAAALRIKGEGDQIPIKLVIAADGKQLVSLEIGASELKPFTVELPATQMLTIQTTVEGDQAVNESMPLPSVLLADVAIVGGKEAGK